MLVTGGYDNTIRFFDATNQRLIHNIQFCDQQVLRLSFSSDGPVSHNAPLFLIAGGSPSVVVYDVTHPNTSPTLFQVHQGHTEAITAVGFEPKHTAFVFSASEDGTLQTWFPQLASQAAHNPYPPMAEVVHPMAAGAYLSDGRMRYESVPATMRNDGPQGSVAIHDAVYYPPCDYFFTVDALGRFRIWKHADCSVISTLVPHNSKRNLQCVELSREDYMTVIMANFDGFVFVYRVNDVLSNPDTIVPITFRGSNRYIPRIRLSFSRALLVCTTCSGAVMLYRMADIMAHVSSISSRDEDNLQLSDVGIVTPLREFTSQRGWIWDAAFVEDRDDYLFTCSSSNHVMLWSLNDLQNSSEYPDHEKGVVCLAVRERMSPDVPIEQFESSAHDQVSQPVNTAVDEEVVAIQT